MKDEVLKALELEKSKREILKSAQRRSEEWAEECAKAPIIDERKYAWEIELDHYKKQRIKEKFWMLGSVCGILAFVLTLVLNFQKIVGFLIEF